MRIEKTEFVLRERLFWECTDFGALMYKKWLGKIALYFGVPAAAISCVIAFGLSLEYWWLAMLISWCIKPLWNRLVLAPAGVMLFDPEARARAILGRLRYGFGGALIADLTWRRFSPFRAFMLPVSMLEGLRKKDYLQRSRWLVTNNKGRIVGLAALFLLLELCVFFSAVGIFGMLDFSGITGQATNSTAFIPPRTAMISYALTVLIVEPVFVLSCFAMYLNRRTVAEGWDLQVVFTRGRARTAQVLAVFLALGLSAGPLSQSLSAQSQSGVSHSDGEVDSSNGTAETQSFSAASIGSAGQEIKDSAAKELSDKKYGFTEKRSELRFKESQTQQNPAPEDNSLYSPQEPSLGNVALAEVLRVLAILAAAALIFLVIFLNRKKIPVIRNWVKKKTVYSPVTVTRTATQPDWLKNSKSAWVAGATRDAIALLYKAGLDLARRLYGIRFAESATEYECLSAVRKNAPAGGEFYDSFKTLTNAWIRTAWAAENVESAVYEKIIESLQSFGTES